MTNHSKQLKIKKSQIILPILIGLGIVVYLFASNFDLQEFQKISWTQHTLIWLLISVGVVAIEHLFFALRLYILSDTEFNFRKSIELIFIWKFSSAVTPTSIGGSAVALVVLSQEKLSTAKTATIVIYTIILDAIFFLIGIPILYFFVGQNIIPTADAQFFGRFGAEIILIITYAIMLIYSILLSYGIFINPQKIRSLLLLCCKLPFLKRYTEKAENLGNDILLTSKEIRTKPIRYHLAALGATFGAWIGKFTLILAIIIALVPTLQSDTSLILLFYSKLQTMFMLIMFFPSPGGTGFAELAFQAFMHGYIPDMFALVIALFWRMFSYYSYLVFGAIIIPNWVRNRWNERNDLNNKKANNS